MSELYGVAERIEVLDDIDRAAEEIGQRGYAIFPSLLFAAELSLFRSELDAIYARQEQEFGREALAAIDELDNCRAPLLYHEAFLDLASHPAILAVARRILGNWIILHLQNGIINRPDRRHHQASWHRDLPYQNWVISRPLSLSAIVTLDDFSPATGGTRLLPFSQKAEKMPSPSYTEANAIDIEAPAGAVVIFDSMLFHQAGNNRSGHVRRAVNHVYTAPIIKQQYDFPRALQGRIAPTHPAAELLGFTSQVPLDDRAWRQLRAQKAQRSSRR
jgi:ectoine hydroxylase-related dioxygenase (phytanoyl-CoA dioxygenase family)